MKPINFPQKNVDIAKDQEEYLTLPAFVDKQETISCWKLSVYERFKLLLTGKLWLRQLNFGQLLQPQLPTINSPFIKQTTTQKEIL